jgi:hypothetical protein
VNELVSMLVPLETLSGWPQVPNPSILQQLTLFVGFPLLIFIIVVAIAKIGTVVQGGRADLIHDSDPLWVGPQSAREAPSPAEAGDEASATLAHEGNVEGDDTGEHVGGAGARW